MKALKLLIFTLLFSGFTLAQVNPRGLYYCKMYRYSGANLVFYCYGSVKIETSSFDSNYLSSSDSSCTGGCEPCWQIDFNQFDSTFNHIGGCISCAEGRLYPNDSIYFKQKQGTAPAVNYYFGNKLYSYPTSVDEIENLNDKVFVYPNPAKDFMYIQSWEAEEIQEILLLDVSGKNVLSAQTVNSKTTEIDLRGLSNGIYFLRVRYKDGVVTKKIVVQN